MTILDRVVCAGACVVVAVGAASGQTPSDQAPKKGTSLTTLSGCVAAGPDGRKDYTLADASLGETYLLKGVDVREFIGKQVQVTGSTSKRLRIGGGLYPSANVAAQAGAIDPTKAAMAGQSGPTANALKPVAEFKVKSVRAVPGACPER